MKNHKNIMNMNQSRVMIQDTTLQGERNTTIFDFLIF